MKLRLVFVLLIALIFSSLSYAQNKNEVYGEKSEYAFDELEEKPEFPDGNNGLVKYLSENVKYPKKALEKGICGKVLVQFVIDDKGKVTKVEVLKGVEKTLDKEAVRVIKSMPKWIPGKKNGKPVKVRYTIPLTFKMD